MEKNEATFFKHDRQEGRNEPRYLLPPPNINLVREGGRAFAAQAPFLWNKLPLEIKQASSVSVFKRLLKTYYFRLAFN